MCVCVCVSLCPFVCVAVVIERVQLSSATNQAKQRQVASFHSTFSYSGFVFSKVFFSLFQGWPKLSCSRLSTVYLHTLSDINRASELRPDDDDDDDDCCHNKAKLF